MTSLDTSLVMIHSMFSVVTGYNLSNSCVRRGDSSLDFGLVKDKALVNEAVVSSI
jgi:hypothetical protein